jgi:hypothetical protein
MSKFPKKDNSPNKKNQKVREQFILIFLLILVSTLLCSKSISAQVLNQNQEHELGLKVGLICYSNETDSFIKKQNEAEKPYDFEKTLFFNINFIGCLIGSILFSIYPVEIAKIIFISLCAYSFILVSVSYTLFGRRFLKIRLFYFLYFAFIIIFIIVSHITGKLASDSYSASKDTISQILEANGVPFDIIKKDNFGLTDLLDKEKAKYSTIIILRKATSISDREMNVLREISGKYGTSLFSFFLGVDSRSIDFFGIKEFNEIEHSGKVDLILENHFDFGLKNSDNQLYQISISLKSYEETRKSVFGVTIKKSTDFLEGIKKLLENSNLLYPIKTFKGFINFRVQELMSRWGFSYTSVREITTGIRLAKVDNAAFLIKNQYKNAMNYYLSINPSSLENNISIFDKIITKIIIHNSDNGFVRFPMSDSLSLRIDDPGCSQNAFLNPYKYKELSDEWKNVIWVLNREKAKLSVFYCSGWVDDGNEKRGKLILSNQMLEERPPGKIYSSKDIIYHDINGALPGVIHNYSKEFNLLDNGVKQGSIDMQSHGWTHLNYNSEKWAAAEDRYDEYSWFREFYDMYHEKAVTEKAQINALWHSRRDIKNWFGIFPNVLVPPGHGISPNTFNLALNSGFDLIMMENYVVFKDGDDLRINRRIVSQLPDKEKESYISNGNPIVVYFHAKDISENGHEWLQDLIGSLKSLGINRIISIRELAFYLKGKIYAKVHNNKIIAKVKMVNNEFEKLGKDDLNINVELLVTLPKNNYPTEVYNISQAHEALEFTYLNLENELLIKLNKFDLKQQQTIEIGFQEKSESRVN